MDEQTEERFNAETGPSAPASFINNLNVIHQVSSDSNVKNQYKTEEYQDIRVTYVDPNEGKGYQTNDIGFNGKQDSF